MSCASLALTLSTCRPLEDIKILKSRVAEPEEEQDQEDEEATGENAVAAA